MSDELDKYLSNQMNPEEMERYTEMLLRKKFDKEQKEEWSKVLKEQYGVDRKQASTKSARISTLRWIVGIAASILLLATAFFLLNQPTGSASQQLAEEYIRTLPIMADQKVFRKGDFLEEETRIKANDAYINGNFATAIRYWEELQANDQATGYDRFYLGVSYLRQKKSAPHQALPLLEASKERTPELIQEINWVLSLAYVKSGQLDKARLQLQAIVDNKAYMDDAAKKLLIALEAE